MNAAIYARRSTEQNDRADEAKSVPRQVANAKAFALARGWTVAKEHVYERSGLETVALRATQFHSLLAATFAAGAKLWIIPVVKGARFQPIAPADVAAALLEAALTPSAGLRHSVRTIGGPEIQAMGEFARQWKAATGSRGRLVRIPLPGAMGKYLRTGLNLVPGERHAGETFSGWLAKGADSL